jgi:hypothetical protein
MVLLALFGVEGFAPQVPNIIPSIAVGCALIRVAAVEIGAVIGGIVRAIYPLAEAG